MALATTVKVSPRFRLMIHSLGAPRLRRTRFSPLMDQPGRDTCALRSRGRLYRKHHRAGVVGVVDARSTMRKTDRGSSCGIRV